MRNAVYECRNSIVKKGEDSVLNYHFLTIICLAMKACSKKMKPGFSKLILNVMKKQDIKQNGDTKKQTGFLYLSEEGNSLLQNGFIDDYLFFHHLQDGFSYCRCIITAFTLQLFRCSVFYQPVRYSQHFYFSFVVMLIHEF